MKKRSVIILIGLAFVFSVFLCGCQVLDTVTGAIDPATETEDDEAHYQKRLEEVKGIDISLHDAEFTKDLEGEETVTPGTEITLDGTATSTDGGKITYQWYSNNVDSNGGGTAIKGATEAIYKPSTKKPGTVFYYVVATNDHGTSCRMTTSNVFGVTVIKEGEWVQNPETGESMYVDEDESYPADTWVRMGNDIYWFNENGYRAEGVVVIDDVTYYFNEDGILQKNAQTPEGLQTDENGIVIGADAAAEGEAAPAEGEAAPAEGEAAPAEGEAAPAEGEAAPAEEAAQ